MQIDSIKEPSASEQPGILETINIEAQNSKQNQTLEALQQSELLQAVWEASPIAMVLSAPDGTVLAANPAYFRLYGFSAETVVGNNFAIIFPEDQRQWAQNLYNYLFTSPIIGPSVETATRRGDGTECIVEASYSFITTQGKRTAMLSIIRDLTERKKTEEMLQRSQQLLTLALEVGQMGTWEWNIETNTVHCSANAEAIYSLSQERLSGSFESFLEMIDPRDLALVKQDYTNALNDGDDYSFEFHVVLQDGSVRLVRVQGFVFADETGKPVRMIGVSQDITNFAPVSS